MTEQVLHKKVCDYIQEYYPNVYFDSDPSGVRVSMHTARLLKATRSRHAHIDLFIAEPYLQYKGLFIELKSESPYLKNGELKGNEHIRDQFKTMVMLREKGYKCVFCWSYEDAVVILNEYLGDPVLDNLPLFQ